MKEYIPRYKENPEWTIDVECVSNGLGYEEETPCHKVTKLNEYDICYEELELTDGEITGIFYYMCPNCHNATIIDDMLLPRDVQEYVIDNNGFDVGARTLK